MVKNKTIVIGCGRLGASIAMHLSKERKSVDIIDPSEEAFRKLSDDFSGNTILADATDLAVLEELGIKKAKRVVITTRDDNTNIYLADVVSKIYQVELVILRLYDVAKGVLLDPNKVKVIYPFNLSFDEFFKLEEDTEG